MYNLTENPNVYLTRSQVANVISLLKVTWFSLYGNHSATHRLTNVMTLRMPRSQQWTDFQTTWSQHFLYDMSTRHATHTCRHKLVVPAMK